MSKNNNTPPIIKIAAWLLSLIVFGVGFWHAHLGMKEMKPFQSEYGSLLIAAIILLLTLITYWFAVNGKKTALIFYSICALSFFVLNLNYFYPAYMAKTLIQNEASTLNDILQKYVNGTSSIQDSENSAAVSDYLNLISLKDQIITEINNKGYGPKARKRTNDFNEISSKYSVTAIEEPSFGKVTNNVDDAKRQREQIEPLFEQALSTLMLKGILNVNDPGLFREGTKELGEIQKKYTVILNSISSDNSTIYKLDSITGYKNINNIVKFVGEFNTAIDKVNKGNNKQENILPRLDEDAHPRADKLGKIKHTITSITERINEIDTWAIIFLCLLIDFIVPLSIYLLIKKKENENEDVKKKKLKPSSF